MKAEQAVILYHGVKKKEHYLIVTLNTARLTSRSCVKPVALIEHCLNYINVFTCVCMCVCLQYINVFIFMLFGSRLLNYSHNASSNLLFNPFHQQYFKHTEFGLT